MRRKLIYLAVMLAVAASLIAQEEVFGTAKKNPFILEGTIYYLQPGTSRLPDFSKLKPQGHIYASKLNVTPRSFSQGFPGVSNRFEWFAIRYRGKIFIAKEGEYTFSLLSDDGSKLFIDGKLVIDNDGVHPPAEKTGSVRLSRGIHDIEVQYFQGPRWEVALVLSIIEKGKKRIFDMKEFSPVKMKESGCIVNLNLASAVLFDFNRYNLKPEAKEVLDTVVEYLKTYPYTEVIVEGHTDSIGSQSYNLKLSKKRAASVARYLIQKGIPAAKIRTVGYGESRPLYPNDTEEHRSKNRRVEIKVKKPCPEKK